MSNFVTLKDLRALGQPRPYYVPPQDSRVPEAAATDPSAAFEDMAFDAQAAEDARLFSESGPGALAPNDIDAGLADDPSSPSAAQSQAASDASVRAAALAQMPMLEKHPVLLGLIVGTTCFSVAYVASRAMIGREEEKPAPKKPAFNPRGKNLKKRVK